jgi:PAS domain S-box-containing protein
MSLVQDATLAQGIADDLPVGIWAAKAPSGELLYANKMFAEILGMSARCDQAAGDFSAPYAIHDREGALYREDLLPFALALSERRAVTVDDLVIHRRDGKRVNIRAQARPMMNAEGVITHVVVAFIDITREVAAERARDAFLSVAAHELRTPIATLQLRVHYLRELVRQGEPFGGERLGKWLTACERQIRRLARLSDQLLDVSRIERGRFAAELEDGDLAALVRATIEGYSELATKPCTIHVEAPASLLCRFDPQRIEYVLVNLVSNAVKYGQGKPVTVRVDAVDDKVRLSVRDEGIGVAPEDHVRIFEPFERAVSARNYGGLGLGLWIVRQYVEAMAGQVRLESDSGAGATFVVELPWRR